MYHAKGTAYYSNLRRDLLDEIPVGPHKVLEVGCGEGDTGAALKAEGRAQWVAGIELVERAARVAQQKLDIVIVGDVERLQLPFSKGEFDVLILGDVLEHLVDPWLKLHQLLQYVSSSGMVVASVPNVRNWRAVFPLLLFGEWRYTESGILDKTHLRFFTKKSIRQLFELNNIRVVKITPLGRKSRTIARLLFGFLSEIVTPQYLVVGIPDTEKIAENASQDRERLLPSPDQH